MTPKRSLVMTLLVAGAGLVLSIVFAPRAAAADTEVTRLKGHKDAVMAGVFSPDGKRIATASKDRTAIVWDATTGAVVQRLEGHANCVTSVAFSGDGRRVVTGSLDRTARVWDVAKGELIAALAGKHAQHVHDVAISPDGTRVLTGSCDTTVVMWDVATEKAIGIYDQPGEVFSVGFAPDGKSFFAGNTGLGDRAGKCLRLYDATRGVMTAEFELPPVRGAIYLDGGKRLLVNTGSSFWDIDVTGGGKPRETRRPGMNRPMTSVWGPSPGGDVCMMGWMTHVELVDATTGRQVRELPPVGPGDFARALAIAPDGQTALIGGGGRGVPWSGGWVPPQNTDVRVFRLSESSTPEPTARARTAPVPGGGGVGEAGWVGGKRPATAPAAYGPQPSGERFKLAYRGPMKVRNVLQRPLPDGKRVLTLDTNGTYAWWDAESGGLYGRVFSSRLVRHVAISPDMERVAGPDKTGMVWVMRPGGIPAVQIPARGNEVTWVEFAADNQSVFTSEAGRIEDTPDSGTRDKPAKPPKPDPSKPEPFGIYRWDAATGRKLAEYRGAKSEVHSFAISPDGATLIAMTEGMPGVPATVEAWDVKTGATAWRTTMPGEQLNKRDYRRSTHHGLAGFSADGTLGLWRWWDVACVFDVRTGKAISTLDRHKNAVGDAAFDPDGRRVWTAAAFDAIRAYDLRTGQVLKTVGFGDGDGQYTRFVVTPKRIVAEVVNSDHEWVERELGN